MLEVKIKNLINILNAEYETKNKYILIVYNKLQVNKLNEIELYIDYENSNGTYSTVIYIPYSKSFDELYKNLQRQTKFL